MLRLQLLQVWKVFGLLPDIGSIREASHATCKCLQLFYADINPNYGTATVTHEKLHGSKSKLYVRTDCLNRIELGKH